MNTFSLLLLIWLAFVLLVYLLMWYESKPHHYHFRENWNSLKDSFQQDE